MLVPRQRLSTVMTVVWPERTIHHVVGRSIYFETICRAFFLPEHATMMRGILTRSKIEDSLVAERTLETMAAST
jgi:hypothetical protein